jgi:hypothetical protein
MSPRSATAKAKALGGVFLMDHETFDVRGQWEVDRGPQHFAYDACWHLGHDTMVTSEWGTPDMFENGLIPEALSHGQSSRETETPITGCFCLNAGCHRFWKRNGIAGVVAG